MIRRSEYGPRCTHCGDINPAVMLGDDGPPGTATCIHCVKPFEIEKLPFYCTDNKRPARCDCAVCRGTEKPSAEGDT